MQATVYVGWERVAGEYPCSHLLGKVNHENIVHVKGKENSVDIGTRMKMITAEEARPGSEYLTGKPLIKLSRKAAIDSGVIKPISNIKLAHKQRKIFKKEIMFDSFEQDDKNVVAIPLVATVDV